MRRLSQARAGVATPLSPSPRFAGGGMGAACILAQWEAAR
jgi:hypothetical protein